MNIDVRDRRHCGNCHECMEYRKWLAQILVEEGESTALQLESDPQRPDISCFEIFIAMSRVAKCGSIEYFVVVKFIFRIFFNYKSSNKV